MLAELLIVPSLDWYEDAKCCSQLEVQAALTKKACASTTQHISSGLFHSSAAQGGCLCGSAIQTLQYVQDDKNPEQHIPCMPTCALDAGLAVTLQLCVSKTCVCAD